MFNPWQKISYAGIREDMPIALQRQIILVNRISVAVAIALAIVTVRNLIGYDDGLKKGLAFIPLVILLGSTPYIISIGHHRLGRLLVAVGLPSYVFFANILFKTYAAPGAIPLSEFIKPAYALVTVILLPLCILDSQYDRRVYYPSVFLVLLFNFIYDPVNNWLGFEPLNSEIVWSQYQILFSHRLLLLATIWLVVSSLKRINKEYEKKLSESNHVLKHQREEIKTQNEELLQSQEEIMTQRDFIEARHKELAVKNEQINDSILAAKTIQQAILPNDRWLRENFQEHFILYQPKDIVSGDFYWIEQYGDDLWIAIADCTGHGVPGAFMTILGNNMLEKVIHTRGASDPATALYWLDEEIKLRLKQEETRNSNGMDIVLLKVSDLKEKNRTVTYAGAKNPLVIFRQATGEMIYTKGSRHSIGDQFRKPEFENHTFSLLKGDMLYAFSDGLADQNNFERKKYSRQRLLGFLKDYHIETTLTQQQELKKDLDSFMKFSEQRDDILLIGCRC